jgi:hypothetical protein
MKLTYPVKLSAIKHEYDPRLDYLATTMHLELPSGVDLKALKHIYRRHLKPERGESGHFHMIVREIEGGAPRRIQLASQGTKTKDFSLFAVVRKAFSAHDGLEQYLSEPSFPRDDLEITFEAELDVPQTLLQQTIKNVDESLRADGHTLTISMGDKSVTLGAKKDDFEA